MTWTGHQVNTFGAEPSRVLLMDATMKGLPVDVLHAYVGPHASMRVRVASLVPLVDAHGADMDQAETVTLLNDMCVLAPAALVDAPIEWTAVDDHHARATFTNAGHTASAVLTFDDAHELVDFVSDDRLRSSADGRTFTRQRWSTPISGYRSFGGRRLGALGAGRWHPDDEPAFDYLEFHTDDIAYLEAPVTATGHLRVRQSQEQRLGAASKSSTKCRRPRSRTDRDRSRRPPRSHCSVRRRTLHWFVNTASQEGSTPQATAPSVRPMSDRSGASAPRGGGDLQLSTRVDAGGWIPWTCRSGHGSRSWP